ncbi:polysaccharide biosynthesis tyrosine autokinase [Candidimonas sp. SYP-B2681]|uniref:polysaccharide biosynthesis tyrosine autokinase n=1 Tax=Candidimonas sp. SYP-B2681 TaxID=2497686 RepID=UPI000F8651F6|nr:polysaccharide biosynthesis tyrosine autokinase [Candidimonas sp. SYP-B2681]RTZ42339.1 polysaccharide biosynthesis tyrosine autokinase [Candidimonas sp. SYP-B2681]
MTTPNDNNPPSLSELRDNDDINFLGLLDVVLEARWLIAAIALVTTLLGGIYAFLSQPVYQADSLIQVEQSQGTTSNLLSEMSTLFDVQSSASAEIEILRSRLVVGHAVDNLQLYLSATPNYLPFIGPWLAARATELSDPGFLGFGRYVSGTESIRLGMLDVPPQLEGQNLAVLVTAEGYELQDAEGRKLTEGKVGIASNFDVDGEPGKILINKLDGKPGAEFTVVRRSRLAMIKGLQNGLVITEKGKQSGVLSITLAGTNPAKITRTLNAVGSAYVQQNIDRKAAEAEKSLAFLDDFLPELKRKMDEAADKYTQFRDAHGTFDLGTEGSLSLNTSVGLETQLFDLEQKRRELSSQFTDEHPNVKLIDEQIRALKRQISQLSGQIKKLPDMEQQLLNLMRDVKVNGELYVNLLNSAQQLRLVKEGKVGNVRVVDTAVAPETPIKPDRAMILAIAALFGLAIGVGVALARNMMRPGIKDPADIESTLGLHVFATVPHSEPQTALHGMISNRVAGTHVLAAISPRDPAVESLRSLRTAMQFAMLDATNNVVLFTGPTPGIGKSFTSVNFATVVGAGGKRVLLVDADLRKGYINQYFGLDRNNGLSELIAGGRSLEQVIHKNVVPNVDLITTGVLPPNPAELLMSPTTASVLREMSAGYDVVLFDTSPVLAVSDAIALAGLAGTVFLLARAEVSTLGEIEESSKRLLQAGTRVKGVIFNGLAASTRRYGSKYGNYKYTNYEYEAEKS